MKRLARTLCTLTALTLPFTVMAETSASQEQIKLYSSSKEHLVRPLLDAFEKESGIKVNLTTLGGSELVARLALEGKDSPADAVMIADVARLWQLQDKALLAPVASELVAKNIPATLRAVDGSWVGIATRARLVFRRKDDAGATITDYRELADKKWSKALLVRSSDNEYNQSLMADMMFRFGDLAAQDWAKGVVANLARTPSGADRDQLRALASGEGRLAVANSYYYAMMLSGEDAADKAYAEALVPMFPDATPKGGTHVNIRGVALTKASSKQAAVVRFIEFLVQPKAQEMLTQLNMEYPANPAVAASALLQSIAPTPTAQVPLSEIGKRNAQTIDLFSRAEWK